MGVNSLVTVANFVKNGEKDKLYWLAPSYHIILWFLLTLQIQQSGTTFTWWWCYTQHHINLASHHSLSVNSQKMLLFKSLMLLSCICSFSTLRVRKRRLKTSPRIESSSSNDRSGRFLNPFSLFHVIQFPNTACTTNEDTQGTCFTSSECSSKGGVASGSCASGFGTCCSFQNTCDTTTQQNGTYFISPATVPTVCSLMISPLNDNICQVRKTEFLLK